MVKFKIDTEKECKKARKMLWDDGESIDICIDYLLPYLHCDNITLDEQKQIAIQILEGRKILRGINESDLIDDGEEIRPISLLISKANARADRLELFEDIKFYPLKYLDEFCSGYALIDKMDMFASQIQAGLYNIDFIIKWRHLGPYEALQFKGSYKDIPIDDPLQRGTYLLQNFEYAYKVLGGPCRNREEVQMRITTYFNKILNELKEKGITYEEMDDFQKAIYERNQHACYHLGIRFVYASETIGESSDKKSISISTTKSKQFAFNEDNDFTFNGEPDVLGLFKSKYGWVSSVGKYYSCGHGGHDVKARYIVEEDTSLHSRFEEYKKTSKIREEGTLSSSFLESIGWYKLHDPHDSDKIFINVPFGKKLTKKQEQVLLDIMMHFKLRYNPITGKKVDWSNL